MLKGYKVARLQGYKATRLQGYKFTRIQGTRKLIAGHKVFEFSNFRNRLKIVFWGTAGRQKLANRFALIWKTKSYDVTHFSLLKLS